MSEPTLRIRSCTTDKLGGGAESVSFWDSINFVPHPTRSEVNLPRHTASQLVINASVAIDNNATPWTHSSWKRVGLKSNLRENSCSSRISVCIIIHNIVSKSSSKHLREHAVSCIIEQTHNNSTMCKVRLVYCLQSVPHPMKNAPIMLPHHVTPPEMKTCCRYEQVSLRFKVQHNDDDCCHL